MDIHDLFYEIEELRDHILECLYIIQNQEEIEIDSVDFCVRILEGQVLERLDYILESFEGDD